MAVAIALAAPAARAAGPVQYEVEVPEALEATPGLGKTIARDVADASYFDGLEADSGAEAFAAPGTGAVYMWWVAANRPADDPARAIRGAFDAIRRSPVAASPTAGSVEITRWDESASGGVAEGELAWRHLSNETATQVRALAYASPEGAPRLVVAECVYSADAASEAKPMCDSALASLALADGARGDLGELPEPAPIEIEAELPDTPALAQGGDAGAPAGDQPTIGEPSGDGVLYKEQPETGGGEGGAPWILVAGGALVALALVMTLRRGRGDRTGSGGDAGDSD